MSNPETMQDLLPWLNLLLLPAVHYLGKISTSLATLAAVQGEHGRRLDVIESRQLTRPTQ